jgi:signal transduction histidine kinase
MQVILEESEILNSTVNNLLQLSQVSGNEEAIRYEKIDFRKFLHDVKDSFDFVNPNNKIEVTSSYKDQGLPLMIRGNKNLLKTAITNLFDNACKFSSNRKVEVMLTMDDKMLVLTITDIGVGILCNDLDKIISPFYRGKNALKVKGSGIGLSLSSKIIMLHQGQLEIQSKIGTGTKVCVKLSLA